MRLGILSLSFWLYLFEWWPLRVSAASVFVNSRNSRGVGSTEPAGQ